MSFSMLVFIGMGVVLLVVLGWVSFSNGGQKPEAIGSLRQEREWRHISYLPQIKQALTSADYDFLTGRGSPELAKRVRRERRRIARDYLSALRTDFEKLLRFAQVISVMSPELDVAQELQGFRLRAEFLYRYQLIRLWLVCGSAPSEALAHLSDMVSGLTVRMETAMAELGERTALVAELASPYNGGGPDAG